MCLVTVNKGIKITEEEKSNFVDRFCWESWIFICKIMK